MSDAAAPPVVKIIQRKVQIAVCLTEVDAPQKLCTRYYILISFEITFLPQVKIFKSDIPEDLVEKALNRVNEALDKYQIEKVVEDIFLFKTNPYRED